MILLNLNFFKNNCCYLVLNFLIYLLIELVLNDDWYVIFIFLYFTLINWSWASIMVVLYEILEKTANCNIDRTHNLRWPRFWFIVVTNGKKYCFPAFSNILDFLDIFGNFFGLKKKFTPRRPRRTDIRDRYRYHIGFSARPRPRPKPRF